MCFLDTSRKWNEKEPQPEQIVLIANLKSKNTHNQWKRNSSICNQPKKIDTSLFLNVKYIMK